jgi:hypothetical protein
MRHAHKRSRSTTVRRYRCIASSTTETTKKQLTISIPLGSQSISGDVHRKGNPLLQVDTCDEAQILYEPNRIRRAATYPFTILGAGRTDPFETISPKPEPYMDYLVDHCKHPFKGSIVWQSFVRVWLLGEIDMVPYFIALSWPSLIDVHVLSPSQIPIAGPLNPLVTKLLPLARNDQGFFYSVLCVAASHLVTLRGGTAPDFWASFYRGEVFRFLKETLIDPQKATSDTTVAIILLLSGHDVCWVQAFY